MNTSHGFTRLDTHRVTQYEPPEDIEPEDELAIAVIQSIVFWIGIGCVVMTFVTLAMGGWLPGAQ